MKVLVAGGTGFIGRHLCRELDNRGHDLTVLARNPKESDLPTGASTAIGDVTAYESIVSAFEGQDAVVNLVALSPLFKPSGGQSHMDVHLGGTQNIVQAAQEHGVQKLVQMSALDADPNGSTEYIRAKGRAEAVVRKSGLQWTIFRPSVVFGDGGEFVSFTRLLTTPYITGLPGGGKTRFQPIWVGDLVPVLSDGLAAEHDEHVYEIGGPEILTLADVAREVYRAEEKSLRVLPIPMVFAKIGLFAADWIPLIPLGSDQYRSLLFDNTVPENDIERFETQPAGLVTFNQYLKGDI